MPMNTSVVVSVISAAATVIAVAVSFYLTKKKEREADWRKYKYEQYKEFLISMSGIVGTDSTPDGKRSSARACNTLHLIGSRGVLSALHKFLDAIGDPSLSRAIHDALWSKLIWEIRQDLGTPGTSAESEFSARLWCPGINGTVQKE
jgi:hypothetical protein